MAYRLNVVVDGNKIYQIYNTLITND